MKTISNVAQIKSMPGKIYVRWSKSVTLDNKRGYSLRYGKDAESGLSVCAIDQTWEDWRILRQIQEYRFLGGTCWIVAGDEIGRGGDNEELLANMVCIAKVSDKLTKANWQIMELESSIKNGESRLAIITDPIGRQIVAASIANDRAKLVTIKGKP